MKKSVLVGLLFLISFGSLLGQVGIGTSSPNSSSILDLNSSGKGLLIPRMTTNQRNNISSPPQGLQVFDTDENCVYVYKNSSLGWGNLCNASTTILGSTTFFYKLSNLTTSTSRNSYSNFSISSKVFEDTNIIEASGNSFICRRAGTYMIIINTTYEKGSRNATNLGGIIRTSNSITGSTTLPVDWEAKSNFTTIGSFTCSTGSAFNIQGAKFGQLATDTVYPGLFTNASVRIIPLILN